MSKPTSLASVIDVAAPPVSIENNVELLALIFKNSFSRLLNFLRSKELKYYVNNLCNFLKMI